MNMQEIFASMHFNFFGTRIHNSSTKSATTYKCSSCGEEKTYIECWRCGMHGYMCMSCESHECADR